MAAASSTSSAGRAQAGSSARPRTSRRTRDSPRTGAAADGAAGAVQGTCVVVMGPTVPAGRERALGAGCAPPVSRRAWPTAGRDPAPGARDPGRPAGGTGR